MKITKDIIITKFLNDIRSASSDVLCKKQGQHRAFIVEALNDEAGQVIFNYAVRYPDFFNHDHAMRACTDENGVIILTANPPLAALLNGE